MIEEYYRPESLPEAVVIIKQKGRSGRILAGGTTLKKWSEQTAAVIDLQALGLSQIEYRAKEMALGATLTLANMAAIPTLPSALQIAIKLQASYNQRQSATVVGSLLSADGRSTFATAMLALNARLVLFPPQKDLCYSDILALGNEVIEGQIVTAVVIPTKIKFAFHSVARTPNDLPLVCIALARWDSGRIRLAAGGWGKVPLLVLDGIGAQEVSLAVRSTFSRAGDEWASAEYRTDVAGVLAKRCLDDLDSPADS